jgi:DNA replication protein DnaC
MSKQKYIKYLYGKLDLIIIDELGFVPLHREGTELLFNVVAQAYEEQSIIVTSNLTVWRVEHSPGR